MQKKDENIKPPILNNPYYRLKLHYGLVNGKLDNRIVLKGNKSFNMVICIVSSDTSKQIGYQH